MVLMLGIGDLGAVTSYTTPLHTHRYMYMTLSLN